MSTDPFTSLQFHLDSTGRESLTKLSRWAKILGTINVVLGGFNGAFAIPLLFGERGLTVLAIPSMFFAGILIYMGLQLTGASSNLRFALMNESDKGFADAIEKIQKFFFLSATLYLVGIFLLFIMMGLGMLSGTGFPDIAPADPSVISI
ncbi:MAG TPA: hypothetical protein EYM47_02830 [Candidatus Marinimicrobia bacterium]|jgi:hypothetical protein|nr:hypothetical protein [Candidatus Neomarinimicrobiota bacterium]HIM73813.1 hypothetical protein [Candidatus Neomarinimicrobiota bacterium]